MHTHTGGRSAAPWCRTRGQPAPKTARGPDRPAHAAPVAGAARVLVGDSGGATATTAVAEMRRPAVGWTGLR